MLTTAGVCVPHALCAGQPLGQSGAHDVRLRDEMAVTAEPDLLRTIALAAVDAAKAAGATYADVRLTREVRQTLSLDYGVFSGERNGGRRANETEIHGIGVRAFVNGMWGFAASPYWTVGEAARLAKDAAAQARENAQVTTSRGELVAVPVVTGTWKTPYEVDPFGISLEDKFAYLDDAVYRPLYRAIDQLSFGAPVNYRPLECRRMESTLATTEGTFVTQHYYSTGMELWGKAYFNDWAVRDGKKWWRAPAGLPPRAPEPVRVTGTGWEALRELPILMRQAADEASLLLNTPVPREQVPKSANFGRYTVVADAPSMAALVGTALRAMDLDRVLGEEVNATGSSWIGNDPVALLETFDFGAPLLSVTANRTLSNGPTSTHWDDEGVIAEPLPLIQQGVLHDFVTTRDRAALLAPAYQKLGRPVRSNGGAVSTSAFEPQTLGVPDAVMTPGKEDIGFEELVASIPRGIALVGASTDLQPDMQLRQFTLTGAFHEISNGRLGAPLRSAALLIDAVELWKNLTAIGGRKSLDRWTGSRDTMNRMTYEKGQPVQSLTMAVQAVPGIFQNMALVDPSRNV